MVFLGLMTTLKKVDVFFKMVWRKQKRVLYLHPLRGKTTVIKLS